MDCKEFEKEIPAFIAGNLSIKELKQFLSHMEKCAECKEELSIQILVTESMIRLEDGNAFDLRDEIGRRIREANERIRKNKANKKAAVITGLILLVMALIVAVLLFAF